MISVGRNVALCMVALATISPAQDATKAKSPCPPATSQATAPTKPPDMSEAAKKSCDTRKGDYWDPKRGCIWLVDLDGDGSNILLIDTQSSTVQKNTSDYEYERLPVGRSVSDIINLP